MPVPHLFWAGVSKQGGMEMGMHDETLIEPFAVQEFFVDGFCDHRIENGMFSCAGYRLQSSSQGGEPVKVVVARFIMRLTDVPDMQCRTRAALRAASLGISEAPISIGGRMLS